MAFKAAEARPMKVLIYTFGHLGFWGAEGETGKSGEGEQRNAFTPSPGLPITLSFSFCPVVMVLILVSVLNLDTLRT